MRRIAVVLVALGLMTVGAMADQMYARGDFNGWDANTPMMDNGNGTFSAAIDISSQTPGTRYGFKVANAGWSIAYPGSDVLATYPAGRPFSLTVFYEPAPTDLLEGWLPQTNRVGYTPGGNPWELVGDFTGWGTNPIWMANLGNDFYRATALIPTAATHDFKFRGSADWEISIGSDFGRWAGNAQFASWGDNEWFRFELDLPHGRYRAYNIPEPASLLLALLGLALRRR